MSRPPLLLLALLTACNPSASDPAPVAAELAPEPAPITSEPAPEPVVNPWPERAEQALAEAGVPGSVIVLDVASGSVLASAERAGHVEHPATVARSPGSTVKPFLTLAALHEHVVAQGESITCGDARTIDGREFTCFHRHGSLLPGPALMASCNHVAFELAVRLGLERMRRHFSMFGLTAADDADSTDAAAAMFGVGHGALAASPMQLAHAYAALASGVAPAGHASEWAYTADELATIRTALIGAVEDERGTGRAAAVPGLSIAGKTGTTEGYDGELEYGLAYFVGWAPADEPAIVVVVQLETEATGPEAAAPVAGRLFAQLTRSQPR